MADKKKTAEGSALSAKDLAEQIDSKKQELMKLREKYATRQLENTSQIRQVRREIARLMTERRVRELQEAGQ
ncbi:MAG: 50S ribosomal protein L29 [Chloroflexi bacterium]|nr:50S ribosomal protein L29 [Chloroflexota bacterium]